jgi:hypothetical protein
MKCKKCEKEHDGSYGKGNFCSQKCSRQYSTLKDKGYKKKILCYDCKKEIEVGKRASIISRCYDCTKKRSRILYINRYNKSNEKNKLKISSAGEIIRTCLICGSDSDKCKRPDICKKYKIFPFLITCFGLNKDKIGTEDVYEEYEKIKNIIINKYWLDGKSIIDLCAEYKYAFGDGNFIKKLKSIDIKLRSIGDGIRLALKNNKIPINTNFKYKQGWHETWDGKQVFLRSSYEKKYAEQLDLNKITYEVETIRIMYWDSNTKIEKLSISDFYIPQTNTIIEIKCDYFYDKQNILDRIKAYKKHGYNYMLILEGVEYNSENIPDKS